MFTYQFISVFFQPILTIEKKGFDHHNAHDELFGNNNNTWVSNDMLVLPSPFIHYKIFCNISSPSYYTYTANAVSKPVPIIGSA